MHINQTATSSRWGQCKPPAVCHIPKWTSHTQFSVDVISQKMFLKTRFAKAPAKQRRGPKKNGFSVPKKFRKSRFIFSRARFSSRTSQITRQAEALSCPAKHGDVLHQGLAGDGQTSSLLVPCAKLNFFQQSSKDIINRSKQIICFSYSMHRMDRNTM